MLPLLRHKNVYITYIVAVTEAAKKCIDYIVTDTEAEQKMYQLHPFIRKLSKTRVIVTSNGNE
jgi:hypothetical protein